MIKTEPETYPRISFPLELGAKTELHETMSEAIQREKALKKWNRAWKLRLIEDSNPNWRDLWIDITA